jgi:membrane fusion protein (multidrug efflux system)
LGEWNVTRRQLGIGAGAIGTLAAIAFGLYWSVIGRFLVGTDDAYVRADVVVITPRVSGYVTEVAVADNQHVHARDLLARIDDRDYRAKVQQAEGAVAAAIAAIAAQEARIANLRAQTDQQRNVIKESTATVAIGEAEAQRADLEYQRQSSLAQQEITSAQKLEGAAADAHASLAKLAAARAALAGQSGHLQVIATEQQAAVAVLGQERGLLQQAQAALTLARLALSYTEVRAPVEGIVGERSLRVGQYAEVGSPLLAVVPPDAYVVANYKEVQIEQVRPGQPVDIEVDAFGGEKLDGHVDSFSPASGAQFALLPPDNATGNFTKIVQRMPVRIRVDAGQARAAELRPGMSVITTIDTRVRAR